MSIPPYLEEAKALFAKGQTEAVLKLLLEHNQQSDHYFDLLDLQRRFSTLATQQARGLLSNAEANLEQNQLNNSILLHIRSLAEGKQWAEVAPPGARTGSPATGQRRGLLAGLAAVVVIALGLVLWNQGIFSSTSATGATSSGAPSEPAHIPNVPFLKIEAVNRPSLVVDVREESRGEFTDYLPRMSPEDALFNDLSSLFRFIPTPADANVFFIRPLLEEGHCLTVADAQGIYQLGIELCTPDNLNQQFRILDAGKNEVVIQPLGRSSLYLAAPPVGKPPFFEENYRAPYTRFRLALPVAN
jgi:hypothetical protein